MSDSIKYLKISPDNKELLTDKLVGELFGIERSNRHLMGSASFLSEFKSDLIRFVSYPHNGRLFVVYSNNVVAGSCYGCVTKKGFGIYKLQVRNDLRNQKLGTKLKLRVVSDLRYKEGINCVYTHTTAKPRIKHINDVIVNKRKNASEKYKLSKDKTTISTKKKFFDFFKIRRRF